MKITKITRFITLLTSFSIFCLLYFSQTSIDEHFFKTRSLQTTGDISLPSNFVNINNLFTLNFDFEPAGFITMAIRFNIPDQYFAIGFGHQMTGTDMWIFQLINSQIVATDSIGIGHVPPPSDVSQGGTDNLETLGYEITPTYSLVKVRRALNTGDPDDAVIQPGLTELIYASGPSPTLVYHGLDGRGKAVVPLIAGTASTVEGSTDAGAESVYEAHALANVIAWGLLVDIGIIIVRFFRGVKLRIFSFVIPIQFIHALLMVIIFCLSIVVTSLILAYNRRERGPNLTGETDIDFHFINGIIILFFLLLTAGLGIANLIILGIYKRKTTPKFTLKRFHSLSGIILYLCTKANVITGVMIHNEGHWRVPVYSYLFGLLLVQIGLEILYFYKVHVSNKPPSKKYKPSKRSMHLALLEEINKGTSREEIIAKFPKVKWVMLGNRVYDLTGWIHPGGNAIIAAVVGREIGRYFYGNHVLEGTKIRPHKHSALTVSQMQSFCIGELIDLTSALLLKNDGKEAVSHSQYKWKIVKSTPITSTISEIRFQNPEIQVKNFGTSLSWLGRHYRVSRATKTSKARLYTTALSLNEANVKLRQNIFKYFDEVMNDSEDPIFAYEDNYLTPQDSLPLYIKNYSAFPKSFSNKVHTTQIDNPKNEFRIEGPLGRGLEFQANSTGTHCIICGGTGILPFIDFLNLFLWKTMYDLIKQKGGLEKAEVINLLNIPFDDILNGMNITFLGAFPNKNEVLGLDIIAKLAEISKKYEVNNFVAMIKGHSDENIIEVKESFSVGFLNKVLSTQEEKFYVVGPPKLNEAVPKALLELGVSKEKIMLV